MGSKIQIFEGKKVRSYWDPEAEEWYFSAVDICNVLSMSASKDPGAYWRKLKQRLKKEGSQVVTNCHGLNMLAEVTTTAISKSRQPETFGQSVNIAREGGAVAGDARKNIEHRIGTSVISPLNASDKLALDVGDMEENK